MCVYVCLYEYVYKSMLITFTIALCYQGTLLSYGRLITRLLMILFFFFKNTQNKTITALQYFRDLRGDLSFPGDAAKAKLYQQHGFILEHGVDPF